MDNKKIKKPRKPRQPKKVCEKKKASNKNKNKNTQSIKINISSSGGLGGSGGTPSIPIPVQSFSRSEKIGENVDVSNLLRRIETQQQSAFSNLMNQQQTAFNNFSNIINANSQEINRNATIDAAEKIKNGRMIRL